MNTREIKIFGGILVVALVLVAFAIGPMLSGASKEDGGNVPPVKVNRAALVPPGSHMRGDPKAPITVVVFSDFQCPSCKAGVPVMENILKKHAGRVNEVFHHFQAKPEHVYAQILARSAEAAAQQGKFWEMHDALYKSQAELTKGSLDECAAAARKLTEKLGLDMARYDAAMRKVDDAPFDRDNALGVKAEIQGTPAYFVIDPQGNVTMKNTAEAIKEWSEKLPAR